jgi:hypothetical protein
MLDCRELTEGFSPKLVVFSSKRCNFTCAAENKPNNQMHVFGKIAK